MAQHDDELEEIKDHFGIDKWTQLSPRKHLPQLLELFEQIDPEVALKLIEQVPELATLARAALEDSAQAYEFTLSSNERSMEMVHEVNREVLRILEAELDRDLSQQERADILSRIDAVQAKVLLHDVENKGFLERQLEKKLTATLLTVVGTVGVALAVVGRSGAKPSLPRFRR